MNKYLILALLFFPLGAYAEKYGCIDSSGKPYFSSSPCKEPPTARAQNNAKISTDVAAIRVMEAGYVDIRIIKEQQEISPVMNMLNSESGPKGEGYLRKEFVLIVNSSSGAKSSYWVHDEGTIYYFSKVGGVVTKKYKISDIDKLRKALMGT
jgi:hypothetical protein